MARRPRVGSGRLPLAIAVDRIGGLIPGGPQVPPRRARTPPRTVQRRQRIGLPRRSCRPSGAALLAEPPSSGLAAIRN